MEKKKQRGNASLSYNCSMSGNMLSRYCCHRNNTHSQHFSKKTVGVPQCPASVLLMEKHYIGRFDGLVDNCSDVSQLAYLLCLKKNVKITVNNVI